MRQFIIIVSILTASICVAAPATSRVWPLSDEGTAWLIENMPNSANIGYPVGDDAPGELPAASFARVDSAVASWASAVSTARWRSVVSRRASTSPFFTDCPTLAFSSTSGPLEAKASSAVVAGTTEPVALTEAAIEPRLTATC